MSRFDESDLESLALLSDRLPTADWSDVERRAGAAPPRLQAPARSGRLRSLVAAAAAVVGVAGLAVLLVVILAGHHAPDEQTETPTTARSNLPASTTATKPGAASTPVLARYGFEVRTQPGWHLRIYQDEPSPPGGRGVEASTVPLGAHGTPSYARLGAGGVYLNVFDYGQEAKMIGPTRRQPPALHPRDFGGRFEGVPASDGFAEKAFTTGQEVFTVQVVTGGGPPNPSLLARINLMLGAITVPLLAPAADQTADPAAIGGYGVAARIPVGWHARVFRKTQPGRTMTVLLTATVPLDNRLDDINGGNTVADLEPGDILISIYSYGPRSAAPGSPPPKTSPPTVTKRQFGRGMEGYAATHTGVSADFASRRYAYRLLVEITRPGPTAAQLQRINALLAAVTVP